jgi:hypothetical protein
MRSLRSHPVHEVEYVTDYTSLPEHKGRNRLLPEQRLNLQSRCAEVLGCILNAQQPRNNKGRQRGRVTRAQHYLDFADDLDARTARHREALEPFVAFAHAPALAESLHVHKALYCVHDNATLRGEVTGLATGRTRAHKHFRLDPVKIKRAQKVLRANTETEAIERALDLVISEHERNRLAVEANERFVTSGIEIKDVYRTLED